MKAIAANPWFREHWQEASPEGCPCPGASRSSNSVAWPPGQPPTQPPTQHSPGSHTRVRWPQVGCPMQL